jgi:hypothetical protein
MIATDEHVWRLSNGDRNSLGLSCTEDGLFLGRTPLLERRDGRFSARTQSELERLLSRGFGIDATLDRVMPGLGAVASALNENELCRARIAAVHLRIPEVPDALARLDMEVEDALIKTEQHAGALLRGEWDPDKHPRTGTAPNPGWFAPTDGAGTGETTMPFAYGEEDENRVKLPPGDRNDEIGDLLEWIANAKSEDVQAISGEISRLFYQFGDFADGAAFHQALIEVLANPDRANRQRILDQYEPITHRDPSAEGEAINDTGAIAALVPLGRGPRVLAPAAEATAAVSGVWKLGWAKRGQEIEQALGGRFESARTIDDFFGGLATSIKSIDIRGATYQTTKGLFGSITRYVDDLAKFDGGELGGIFIMGSDITARTLKLAIPKVPVTPAQQTAVEAAIDYARSRGITLQVIPF